MDIVATIDELDVIAKVRQHVGAKISRRKFVSEVAAFGTLPVAVVTVDSDGRAVLEGAARKKKSLGQYFTHGTCWLQPQIVEFIRNSKCHIGYDPFAGNGCLLEPVVHAVATVKETVGLDIDPSLGWEVNDSLIKIPSKPGAIIVTNPPYFSNYSASRKGLGGELKKLTEVINFIRYAESNVHIHYVTYLDGEYSNLLHSGTTQPKIRCQYDDVLSCLRSNPVNYFLNTAGFEEFMRELVMVAGAV